MHAAGVAAESTFQRRDWQPLGIVGVGWSEHIFVAGKRPLLLVHAAIFVCVFLLLIHAPPGPDWSARSSALGAGVSAPPALPPVAAPMMTSTGQAPYQGSFMMPQPASDDNDEE